MEAPQLCMYHSSGRAKEGREFFSCNQPGNVSRWLVDAARGVRDAQNQEGRRGCPCPIVPNWPCHRTCLSSMAQDAFPSLTLLLPHSTASQACWENQMGRRHCSCLLLLGALSFSKVIFVWLACLLLRSEFKLALHLRAEICSPFILEIMQSTPRLSQNSLYSYVPPPPPRPLNPHYTHTPSPIPMSPA